MTVINLNFKEILTNKNEIYAIKNNCKNYNKIKICKRDHLINLSNDNCIKNILSQNKPSCTTSNVQHIPRIEEISDGIILLNDVNETISTEVMKYDLKGTFVIKFENSTIRIGEKSYKNFEAPQLIPIPASMQQTPVEEARLNLLSLESLQELHFNNTKVIHNLKKEAWIRNFAIFITFLITVILAVWLLKKSRKRAVTTLVLQPTNVPQIEESKIETSITRIHDLPYF